MAGRLWAGFWFWMSGAMSAITSHNATLHFDETSWWSIALGVVLSIGALVLAFAGVPPGTSDNRPNI